ncbi:MAG: PadR family transcriptional regulator [Candidatus Cloacimonadota bacterium]|nr:MAG: PadR family transcriptional regulator [Candidatus Cloacimonadota bacterium]
MGNNKEYRFAYNFLMTNIDHILLETLAVKPNHGYGLIEQIRKEHKVLLGNSTIYPSLKLLEKHGLVRHHWDTEAARAKKIYMVTEIGRQTVRNQRIAIQQILSKLGPVS